MKGIVFTELLDLVETKFGYETVDLILTKAQLPNGGAYTSVGTYDFNELIQLVSLLSTQVKIDSKILVTEFGRHLFRKFSVTYHEKLVGLENSFDLLEQVEGYIHVEVRKLYPNAELPRFYYKRDGNQTLEIEYLSKRPFADLCEGLISACIMHFKENISIVRNDIETNGTHSRFILSTRTEM